MTPPIPMGLTSFLRPATAICPGMTWGEGGPCIPVLAGPGDQAGTARQPLTDQHGFWVNG